MINKFKAFCIIKDGKFLSADYKKLQYHFVFDVKFDGRRKACWVMDSNFTPSMPQEECFASVVSTEAVCLSFVLAQIQGL